jgi:large subunit ribosomal protein L3
VVVTLLQILPQEVARIKTSEKDGYVATVVWVNPQEKTAKSGKKLAAYDFQGEFVFDGSANKEVGTTLDSSLLEWVKDIRISGMSKWKGFQWYIKRFHARGMPATHGHKYTKHGGSIGNRKPRRTQKGHPNPWHMGYELTTLQHRTILDVLHVNNEQLIVVKGSLPGPYNGDLKLTIE